MSVCTVLSAYPSPGPHCCFSSLECSERCSQENESSAGCDDVACTPRFLRCDCGESAVLDSNGGCVASLADQAPCEPRFTAYLSVVAWPTPELTPEDMATASPSGRFVSVLRKATAAAVGSNETLVGIGNARFTLAVGDAAALTVATLLQFDLSFSFCYDEMPDELEGASFEAAFRVAAKKFAVLSTANFAFQRLEAPMQNSTGGAVITNNAGASEGASETAEGSLQAVHAVLLIILILGIGSSLACCMLVARRRHKRALAQVANLEDDLEGPTEEATLASDEAQFVDQDAVAPFVQPGQEEELQAQLAQQVVLASVTYSFAPKDVEGDEALRQSLLTIREGEVVEVLAGGGGWLYGRVVGGKEGESRVGYFPESRCVCLRAVPSEDAAAEAGPQRLLVALQHPFSAASVQDGATEEPLQPFLEECLVVEAGEVVEVTAGGAGWLYGRVSGAPGRQGYFPESYAVPLEQQDDEKQADQTSEGRLVTVNHTFYPGVPGDEVEEAVDAFCDTCLALAMGDVVEVLAAGGGWLYGRLLGDPRRVGYFPENRVAWLGRSVEGNPAVVADSLSPGDLPPQGSELRQAADPSAAGGQGPVVATVYGQPTAP